MKSFLPWLCLVTFSSQVFAVEDGIQAYRRGDYALAAKYLPEQAVKIPEASFYLGLMKLYGYGVLKNNAEALEKITQAAERGFLPAANLLARYYLLKDEKPEEAFRWFKKVAESGDTLAQMYVASAYLSGYGVKKNQDLARRYIIDAAKSGDPIAQFALSEDFLASRNHQTKKMGLIWLEKAADKKNPRAEAYLGRLLLEGKRVEKDISRAVTLLTEAAEAGDVSAMITLGKFAETEQDRQTAKAWFEKAAKQNAEGMIALSQYYLTPQATDENPQEGFQWMLKAAQNNSLDAARLLSKMYETGQGVAKNETLSQEWQEKAKRLERDKRSPRLESATWLNNGKARSFETAGIVLGGIYDAWQNPKALSENIYNKPPVLYIPKQSDLFKPDFTMVDPKALPISVYFNKLVSHLNTPEDDTHFDFPTYAFDPTLAKLLANKSLALNHDLAIAIVDKNKTWPLENTTAVSLSPYEALENRLLPHLTHKLNFQAALTQLYGRAILGESSAQYQLGQLYQYGIGVAKNIPQALTYLELAAMQQDIRAEYNLGVLYLTGQTTPINYRKGIEWMTDAAFKGNRYAEYVLARIYESGLRAPDGSMIVSKSPEEANAMYYLAASNHFGQAEYRLAERLVKEKQPDLNVQSMQEKHRLIKRLYRAAVSHGVPEALLPLAFYDAMSPNHAKQKHAFEVATREANLGDANAALLLAMMYERGIATDVSQKEALHWYREARMNAVNAFILGTYYCLGEGVSRDLKKCRAFLTQSSEEGFSYADFNLAILQHDLQEPFRETLNKAQAAGNSRAGMLLADDEMLTLNDPQKIQHALSIYQYFAAQGDKDAETKLGFIYDRGLAGIQNADFAKKWYELAANQGAYMAQYLLAELYQFGVNDKTPDYSQAKKWYRRAMVQYAPAANALGMLEETVDNHYQHAFKHYEKAAQANNPDGQYNLGLMYQYGKGMAVDASKAEALFKAALENGHIEAANGLASLYLERENDKDALFFAMDTYQKQNAFINQHSLYNGAVLSILFKKR